MQPQDTDWWRLRRRLILDADDTIERSPDWRFALRPSDGPVAAAATVRDLEPVLMRRCGAELQVTDASWTLTSLSPVVQAGAELSRGTRALCCP